jgi:TolB-like protein
MPAFRQLAAILFTDIEGYTAIMQENEGKGLLMRDRHRLVLENEHKNFNGTIVQYYGDGTLSIFSSVVQAVECAVKMQHMFQQMPLVPVRMGLHVGDIMMNDGDVFGDGVNVASRIESLGIAGSVLISDKVNDEIHNHPELKTFSVGKYFLKNIEREVEVFALNNEGLVKPVPNSLKGKTQEKKSHHSALAPKKSVAVLPFVNMSNDPDQEYFSDGIAEEILNSLSHLNDLKVAGRTSSFQFKGKNADLRQVGHKLGVSTVLEGSVRKQQNHLRVTVQLVDVHDGFHLWSEKYDREIDDIFAIQDEIALSVTEKLKITLLETEKAVISNNTRTEINEAYDYYLKGRFYWNRRGPALKKALEYFQMAAELDSEFSLAYAGLADTYALFGFYSVLPSHKVIPLARQAAEKAIELNPSRVEPYSVLAYITTFHDWDWDDARSQYEKALAINSGYAPAHYWYSNFLGWTDKDSFHAVEEAFKAIEIEPLVAHSHTTLASAYLCFQKFEEARKAAEAALDLDANSFLSYCGLSLALHGLGKNIEALEAIQSAVNVSARHPYPLHILAWLYSTTGNVAGAQRIFGELTDRSKTEFISALSLSIAAYSAQDRDLAFDLMEKAFVEKAGLLVSINRYPFLSFVKTDPRFQPFFKRMNYPE